MSSMVDVSINVKLNKSLLKEAPELVKLFKYYHDMFHNDPEEKLDFPFTDKEWTESEWQSVFIKYFNSNRCVTNVLFGGDTSRDKPVRKFTEEKDYYLLEIYSGFKYRSTRMQAVSTFMKTLKSYIVSEGVVCEYISEDNFRIYYSKKLEWHTMGNMKFDRMTEEWTNPGYNKQYAEKYNMKN